MPSIKLAQTHAAWRTRAPSSARKVTTAEGGQRSGRSTWPSWSKGRNDVLKLAHPPDAM